MRRVLCILSSDEDALGKEVIEAEERQPDCSVKVLKLERNVNYDQLLDAVLEADSVQVW
jgi:hypothetical protein